MNEELTPQKERFLREVEQKLLRRDLDAKLLEDGLIHVRWNEKPLCSVDRDGIVRFRPADKVVRVLRGIFNAAVDNNLIAKSPVPAILRIGGKSNAGRRSPLNSLSAFWTRQEERGHIFSACWHFKTGMRRGELCGLMWSGR